ncbi:hypothetical protein VST7929_01197 [Vibrio stylophorae]|uniref:DUF3450 domain-containing protein n=1 Tax=Vibrio stylophorae TaxID=659351 RepID=A0ABM8ZSN9_9VIBR|nr:DUF3450 domain-containing protein [Vibrio stylophorae]CAH0533331.1 hypothetical protein VST7929_01197 [Vibrio stylophorae]
MRIRHILWPLLGLLSISSPALANVKQAQQEAQSGLSHSAQQQNTIDHLEDERSQLYFELSALNRQISQLETYNAHLQTMVEDQQQTLKAQVQKQQEIAELKRALVPLMYEMLSTLDQFYQQDVPFLPDERRQRMASLQQMMARSDVSDGEKLRRILQAYNIELEYGQTISQYAGDLNIDQNKLRVVYTRVGRIALLAHVADMSKAWWFDGNSWQPLSRDGIESIQILSAQLERRGLPQMVALPLMEASHD